MDPNHIIGVCKYLVNEYADTHDFSTEDIRDKLTIKDLVTWTVDELVLENNRDEIAKAGIPENVIDVLREIFEDPYLTCDLLNPMWILITRPSPPLSSNVIFTSVVLTLAFEDNCVVQTKAVTPWKPGKGVQENFVITCLQDQCRSIIKTLAELGLERVKEKYGEKVEGTADVYNSIIRPHLAEEAEKGADESE